eukprot:2259720-Alexandrium_andersonii.AAC.1
MCIRDSASTARAASPGVYRPPGPPRLAPPTRANGDGDGPWSVVGDGEWPVSYTHLRAHETSAHL